MVTKIQTQRIVRPHYENDHERCSAAIIWKTVPQQKYLCSETYMVEIFVHTSIYAKILVLMTVEEIM